MKRFVRSVARMEGYSYRRCFFVYLVVFFALFAQVCGGARVMSPLRQMNFGAETASTIPQTENSKFSDYVTYAIPEATVFLHGKRSGWIATWNPLNELGRPTSHLSGLSPAYFPNWILSNVVTDSFVYVTAIAVLAMFLAGTSAFLLARELQLLPAAALTAALAIGLSPALIYWATFPMFAAAYGWTAAALYGLARFIRCRDPLAWAIIAFAVYSLLMTAYPVMVVYHVYIAIGFFVYLAYRHPNFPRSTRPIATLLLALSSAVAFGILAALPALTDTLQTAAQSARAHPDVSFLRAAIQPLQTLRDWIRYLAFWTFPQLLGNPISTSFPSQFIGRSLAPFAVFLVCVSDWRRTWGWWVAILILIAAEVFSPVFAFAVNYLGIGLSRSVPTVLAIIPLAMIAATNLDSAISTKVRGAPSSDHRKRPMSAFLVTPAIFYVALLADAAKAASLYGIPIDYLTLFAFIAYLPALILAMRFRLPGIIIAVAVAHLLIFDHQMLLSQPRNAIVQSTPTTQRLQLLLAGGGRFAESSSATAFMPPNMNAQIMLPSVHSYDSLSPVRYQELIRRLGGEVLVYGRINTSISMASLSNTDFHLANIRALLTREPIESTGVVLDSSFDGLLLYRVIENWGAYVRCGLSSVVSRGGSAQLIDATAIETQAAAIVSDAGDRIYLHLAHNSAATTLLVASQSYNINWHADARSGTDWRSLQTLPVDDAYEGIVVPAGVDTIRLRFTPWVWWSWLGHVAFCALALLLTCSWCARVFRGKSRSETS